MTPEMFMILLGALTTIIGAFAYAWRAHSDVQKLRAETERMKAQTDNDENANLARLIEFTGRLTTAIDTIASGLQAVDATGRQQTTILSALVNETKAMRADIKAWPEVTAFELRAMKEQIEALETSVGLLIVSTDKHRENIAAVERALVTLTALIERVVKQHGGDGDGAAAGAVETAAAA